MSEEKKKRAMHFICDGDGFLGKGFPPNKKGDKYDYCSNCGMPILLNQKRCSFCGKKKAYRGE